MLCNIDWIKDARKVAIPVNTKYSATTYIKEINCALSITIEIKDNINKGYLTFLRAELVEKINLTNVFLDVMEGRKRVTVLHILKA